MNDHYQARHRRGSLDGRLGRFLVMIANAVIFIGLVLLITVVLIIIGIIAYLMGEFWWDTDPKLGILWWSALALIVPTALLGRWKFGG